MLYHREVNWPKKIAKNLPFGLRMLEYSNHAIAASRDDRYGGIQLLRYIDMDKVYIFEAEWDGQKVVKVVFRYTMHDGRDLVVAAIPMRGYLYVKTVWINLSDDNHKTLDKSRYVM